MPPSISVVIPTRNGGHTFHDVLQQLRRQQCSLPIEIVVIDSESTDDTVVTAKTCGAHIISIAPESFNHGATRNFGIEHAKGEFIVLMTQDAVPADEFLIQRLVEPFVDPQVAGTYARQIPRPDADVLTKRNVNRWLTGRRSQEVRWIADATSYRALSPMDRYLFCNFDNVCSAVRRAAWERLPFRSTDFGEDIEWSKRVLEDGWKIAYQPSAHVIHSHDRPIAYEYRRTYLCHRMLYEIFGLRTIPTWAHVVRCACSAMTQDMAYVLRNEPRVNLAARLLLRVPPLSIATTVAQYRGARDARSGHAQRFSGI